MIFLKVFILFCCLFSVQELYSYIDPGTGTYLIQLLIAFLAGALYFVKVFWNQIKHFFSWLYTKIKTLFGK